MKYRFLMVGSPVPFGKKRGKNEVNSTMELCDKEEFHIGAFPTRAMLRAPLFEI
ncbi:hypothetical protein AAMO2058_001090600 [Amorphochlora amoebiformis]